MGEKDVLYGITGLIYHYRFPNLRPKKNSIVISYRISKAEFLELEDAIIAGGNKVISFPGEITPDFEVVYFD